VRTTLTLDDDLAARLKCETRKSGKSFKEVVNEALREGLAKRPGKEDIPPFKVKARRMGLRPGLSYDCVGELLEQIEGPFDR
jgi:hypothetical protein